MIAISDLSGSACQLQIIDVQVHANKFGQNWKTATHEQTLIAVTSAMDALGVDRMVIHEYSGRDAEGRLGPGKVEADNFWRPHRPFSRAAVAADANRFAYLGEIDWLDPKLPQLMQRFSEDPLGPIALRLLGKSTSSLAEEPHFLSGGLNTYFEQAERWGLPVFVVLSPRAGLLADYAQRFPGCQFILDHMGLVSGADTPTTKDIEGELERRLDQLMQLSLLPNVAIKWCHPERIASRPYPFIDMITVLRQVINSFGAHRIMWSGDPTESANPARTNFPITWSQSLHYILDTPELTFHEKELIFAKTALSLLKW